MCTVRCVFVAALVAVLQLTLHAFALTTAQRVTLKADILATPEANALYAAGNLSGLIAFYNANAAPDFTVWKSNVPLMAVGDAMVATEVAGLTSINLQRLQVLAQYRPNGVNPSIADNRAAYDDIFSGAGGAQTRPKLLALWKRLARRVEKLFATGTGSDAVPATLVFEGALTIADVQGL